MHPGDHADHRIVRSRVQHRAQDRLRIGQHRTPDDLDRDVARLVEQRGDLLRLLGDLGEGLFAVQPLTAGEEPDLLAFERILHGVTPLFVMDIGA
ncbi:hypothetical protein SDC9_184229 [bioreactor metagenome]|uniref:Uncharacterized protein n=1 Tax=bioreactor metagenome TaxID=1076179 RepID=A0A645HEZ7_9ZZZZ